MLIEQEGPLRLGLSICTRNIHALSRGARLSLAAALLPLLCATANGQTEPATCTTQAAMTGNLRQSLADTALALASAIKADDSSRVQSMSAVDIAANFNATSFLIQRTSTAIAGETLRVTHLYRLDASSRRPGETSEADFGCPLSGTTDEVDFAIPGLPAGVYAFVMVDADGPRPWLLPLLLEQQGSAWKMAGFYPHARSAAGHDGLWYWTTARADAKAGKKWLAWVLYGQADLLLRPANFVSTTHLDQLRSERHTNAPAELSDGITAQAPLVIKAKDGTEFHFTGITAAGTSDGKGLDLVLHYKTDSVSDSAAASARNTAAATALLDPHPELREGFAGVTVYAEAAGQNPFITQVNLSDIH